MRRIVWTVALFTLGCGGGGGADTTTTGTDTDQQTAGNDDATRPPGDGDGDTDVTPPTPAAGPATVHLVIKIDGQEAAGHVKLMDSSGDVVGEGESGTTVNVTSGTFTAEAHITDAAVIVNRPTVTAGPFDVAPGETHEQVFELERARVRLTVVQRGRPVSGARITLHRQNAEEEPIEIRATGQHVPFMPGRYDATVRFGNQSIDVTGLMFMGSAQQDVPINVN